MKRILLALQFLTVLPVRIRGEVSDRDKAGSMIWFPAVGLLIGTVLYTAGLYMPKVLPVTVTSALLLILLALMTGCLHLDGFADTCDGLYAGKSREDALNIMKDSRLGVMGTTGLICLMLLKYMLIKEIIAANALPALMLAPMLGRWAMVISASISKYAREDGTGKSYIDNTGIKELSIATVFTLALAFILKSFQGIVICLIVFTAVFLITHFFKKKLGGITGDTIGATGEIIEVIVLIALIAFVV